MGRGFHYESFSVIITNSLLFIIPYAPSCHPHVREGFHWDEEEEFCPRITRIYAKKKLRRFTGSASLLQYPALFCIKR